MWAVYWSAAVFVISLVGFAFCRRRMSLMYKYLSVIYLITACVSYTVIAGLLALMGHIITASVLCAVSLICYMKLGRR